MIPRMGAADTQMIAEIERALGFGGTSKSGIER